MIGLDQVWGLMLAHWYHSNSLSILDIGLKFGGMMQSTIKQTNMKNG